MDSFYNGSMQNAVLIFNARLVDANTDKKNAAVLLANGKINIAGNEESVSGWTNSQKTLSYIREHNNW